MHYLTCIILQICMKCKIIHALSYMWKSYKNPIILHQMHYLTWIILHVHYLTFTTYAKTFWSEKKTMLQKRQCHNKQHKEKWKHYQNYNLLLMVRMLVMWPSFDVFVIQHQTPKGTFLFSFGKRPIKNTCKPETNMVLHSNFV